MRVASRLSALRSGAAAEDGRLDHGALTIDLPAAGRT